MFFILDVVPGVCKGGFPMVCASSDREGWGAFSPRPASVPRGSVTARPRQPLPTCETYRRRISGVEARAAAASREQCHSVTGAATGGASGLPPHTRRSPSPHHSLRIATRRDTASKTPARATSARDAVTCRTAAPPRRDSQEPGEPTAPADTASGRQRRRCRPVTCHAVRWSSCDRPSIAPSLADALGGAASSLVRPPAARGAGVAAPAESRAAFRGRGSAATRGRPCPPLARVGGAVFPGGGAEVCSRWTDAGVGCQRRVGLILI